MSRQIINVGGSANDGTGDTLRAAAVKINDNFVELYGVSGLVGVVQPPPYDSLNNGAINFNYTTTVFKPSASRTWTMPNGNYDGQVKKIVNVANGLTHNIVLQHTAGNIATRGLQDSSPTIRRHTVATCEWYNSKWYVNFNQRDSDGIYT